MDSCLHNTVSCWAEIENCVRALIVIPDEQCGAMVRLWEKQITERLEGASGHDLVQLLFAEQNELEQIAQDEI